jgi:hypothetical protein
MNDGDRYRKDGVYRKAAAVILNGGNGDNRIVDWRMEMPMIPRMNHLVPIDTMDRVNNWGFRRIAG